MFWFLTRKCKGCDASKAARRKSLNAFTAREGHLMVMLEDRNKVISFLQAENVMLKQKLNTSNNNGDCGDYSSNGTNESEGESNPASKTLFGIRTY